MTYRDLYAATAAAALTLGLPAAAAAQDDGDGVISLDEWDYDEDLGGQRWHAEALIGADVIGDEGEEFGNVENIVVNADGSVESVIVEAGGFLDMGDTHLSVPWDNMTYMPEEEAVQVSVSADNVDSFTLFETRGEVEGPSNQPNEWRVTELLDDYVLVNDGVGFGLVEDVVFSQQGQLQAVVVKPDVQYDDLDGVYAYPFYGYGYDYGYGFNPGWGYYELPYGLDEASSLEPYDYDVAEF